jgi:hypothetical protein
VGVVEDEAVGGDDGEIFHACRGDEDAIGGITMNGSRQGVSFLDDLQGDWDYIPAVTVGLGAEPFFPVLRKLDFFPFLQAGEFGCDDRAAVDDLSTRGDELEGCGAESLGRGGEVEQRASIEQDHRAPLA